MKRDDFSIFMLVLLIAVLIFDIIEIKELKNENDRLQTEVNLLKARDDINAKHIEKLHLLGGEELMKKIYAEEDK